MEQNELVNEIFRVLKPNGIVIISEFKKSKNMTYSNTGCFLSDLNIIMKHYEINEIENIFRNFKKIKIDVLKTQTVKGAPIESINCIWEKAHK